MVNCCVPGCTHRTGKRSNPQGITFHLIPKNAQLRNAWLKAIGRPNWKPGAVTHLCSAHFKPDDFIRTYASGIVKLKEDVIPSEFNCTSIRAKKGKSTAIQETGKVAYKELSEVKLVMPSSTYEHGPPAKKKKNSLEINSEGEVTTETENLPTQSHSKEGEEITEQVVTSPYTSRLNTYVLFAARVDALKNSHDLSKCYFRTDISDFEEIVKTVHFIDKTMLIKTFFEDTGKVIITAPRQFGKSVNLNMLKTFLNVNVDVNGIPLLDLMPTSNYRLFSENNLKIYQDQKFFHQHFGQYPVMFVDLKSLNGSTFKEILTKLREVLYYTFIPHKYVLKGAALWEGPLSKETFMKYCHSEYHKKLTKAEIETGFKFLSQVLFEHFHKKVFVLVDDYDAPIQKVLCKQSVFQIEAINFIYETISGLLKINYVDRALINANSPSGILPGFINNIKIRPFLEDHSYSEFFGLTMNEVEELLQKNEFKLQNNLVEIQSWYGGYNTKNKNIEMSNTWSVINYLQEKKIGSYWIDSGYIPNFEDIFRLYEVRVLIEDLMEDKYITIKIIKPLELKHINSIRKLIHDSANESDFNVNLFFQLLFELGYLIEGNSNYSSNTICLKIPNLDALEIFKRYTCSMEIYIEKFNITQELIHAFHSSLQALSAKADQDIFVKFSETVNDLYSVCTIPITDFEVHAIFFTLAKQRYPNTRCHIHIGARKRFDVIIIREDNLAIIVELKYLKTSISALLQIFDHDYYKFVDYKLVKEKVHDRIHIGLNIDEVRTVTISYLINTDITENANHVPEK